MLYVKKSVNCFYIYLLLFFILFLTQSNASSAYTEIESLINMENNLEHGPNLPKEMPQEVMFLQNRLKNSFKMAFRQVNDPKAATSNSTSSDIIDALNADTSSKPNSVTPTPSPSPYTAIVYIFNIINIIIS